MILWEIGFACSNLTFRPLITSAKLFSRVPCDQTTNTLQNTLFKLLSRELWAHFNATIWSNYNERARGSIKFNLLLTHRHLNIHNARARLSGDCCFSANTQKPFRFCDNLVHFIVLVGFRFAREAVWSLRETAKGHTHTHTQTLFEYVKYYINELAEVD